MALVNKVIPNLYNGISQQAPSVRHESQGELQENCMSSIVYGLHRRPPLRFVKNLWNAGFNNTFVHLIDRSPDERYVIQFAPSGIKIYNIATDTFVTADDSGGTYVPYINYGTNLFNPAEDLVVLTIADTTIILNKNVKPAKKTYTTMAGALQGTKQRFSDLPATPTAGHVWEIAGDNTNSFDNYYVRGTGTAWVEHGRPGENYQLDPAYMPHKLVRNADGTWTFSTISWNDRLVGDLASIPFPSFVGKKMNDMFFFRNRLGFLADENIIFSRAGDFFNFFPETATAVLDSDPIDVSISHTKISILNHAVPFDKSLLIFSNTTQFQVESGDALTPKAIQIHQTTEFECSPKVRPVAAGPNVYFASEKQNNSDILEYFAQEYIASNDADNITAHCPAYLPKNIVKIAAASNQDLLFLLSSDERNAIYVYKYYWKGDEKVQSSWSKWTFGDEQIATMDVIEGKLYITSYRNNPNYMLRLWYINLQEEVSTDNELTDVFLDDLVWTGTTDETGIREYTPVSYDGGSNTTTLFRASAIPVSLEQSIAVFKGKGFPDSEIGDEMPMSVSVENWTPAADSWMPKAWYKPDSLVDGPLSSWADSGEVGTYTATQATVSKRPTVTTNQLNGNPVVTFDGTDDYLSIASDIFDPTLSTTIFAVMRESGATGTAATLFRRSPGVAFGVNPSTNTVGRLVNTGSGAIGSWNPQGSTPYSEGQWTIAGMRAGIAFGNLVGYKDGVSDTPTALPAFGLPAETSTTIGSLEGTSEFFKGDIAEIIIYNTELEDTERQRVEGYLAHKYGLTANLPADHPYKVDPPRVGTYTLSGNHMDKKVYVGIPYTSKYQLSPQYPRDSSNNSVLAQSSIKLKRMRTVYNNTGQFTIKVTPKDRSTYSYQFKATDPLDSQGNVTPIGTGVFSVPIMGDGKDTAIVIEESSYRPFAIQALEFEQFVQMRSRRI